MPLHTCQNGHHKQINKQQVLARLWRKGNPSVLSWECRLVQPLWKTVWNFLRKLNMELPFDLAIPLLGLYPKSAETPIQKNLCTPMFIAAQFTIAKYLKQPKFPPGSKNYVHLHNGILCSRKKEGASTFYHSTDRTGEHYAK